MRVNRFLVPVVALAIFLGTVWVAQAAGLWMTNGRAGTDLTRLTAADLKGWMTLQDVAAGLNISQSKLYAAGKIPTTIPPSTALNKLEATVPGFSVTGLRDTLTAKLGTGAVAGAPPTQAPAVTGETGLGTLDPTPTPGTAHATPTKLPAGQVLPGSQIKGSMSIRTVSEQCAVPLDRLVTELKLGSSNPDTLIKDLVAQGKLTEVSQVQRVVTEMQTK